MESNDLMSRKGKQADAPMTPGRTCAWTDVIWRVGHRINAARMPGMASRKPRKCKAQTANQAVSLDRFQPIDRTAWIETTPLSDQRAQSVAIQQEDALHEPSRYPHHVPSENRE